MDAGQNDPSLASLARKPVPKPRPRPRENSVTSSPVEQGAALTSIKPTPPVRKQQQIPSVSVDQLPLLRRRIEELILAKQQEGKFELACSVMQISCALNTKYEIIHLMDLLCRNKDKEVSKIPQAFNTFEKYAISLLKDESSRHKQWKYIQFSSSVYQSKIKFLDGALDILKSLGYTDPVYNNGMEIVGVRFPEEATTNTAMILKIAVDLVIAQYEVEAMLMGHHPHMHSLQTMEDVPGIYFPHSPENDNFRVDPPKPNIDKVEESRKMLPPPVPVRRSLVPTNVSSTTSPSISPDYKQQLSLFGRNDEISKEIPNGKRLNDMNENTVSNGRSNYENVDQVSLVDSSMAQNSMQCFEEVPSLISCLKCGSKERPHSKFCSECGNSLKSIKSSQEMEVVSVPPPPPPVEVKAQPTSLSEDEFQDADEGWNCEHCTYVNSHQTTVCAVCDRTSSIIRDKRSKQNEYPNGTASVFSNAAGLSETVLAGNFTNNNATGLSETVLAGNFTNNNATGLSETVLAGNFTNSNATGLSETVLAGNFTTISPTNFPLQHPLNDRRMDGKKLQEARKFAEEEELMKRRKKDQEEQCKRQKIIQEQNTMRTDGQNLVALLMFCENSGYTVDECFLAQEIKGNLNQMTLLNWLQNDWHKRVTETIALCNQIFQNDKDVGPISREEARDLLLHTKGVQDEVPNLFAEKRKKQCRKLAMLVQGVQPGDIIKSLFNANGDEERALQSLYVVQFQGFHESILRESLALDFEKLKDANIPQDVKRRMVMVQTGVSWGRSDFIFRLLNAGVEATIDELMFVIKENTQYTYDQCLKFFKHECPLCTIETSLNQIRVDPFCNCELCLQCYSYHLKYTLRERHIRNLVCPLCFKPDIDDPNFESNYYYSYIGAEIQHLVSENLLEPNIKEIFDNNLLDFFLKKHENFRYCINCKNGFLWENINQIRMQCNQCNERMCFLCKEKWMDQHDNTTCEDFKAWKEANDPERQEVGVQALLQGRKIECPDCKAPFELAQGGCMHFTCAECKYEFCSGCYKAFKRDGQCQVHPTCEGKGMHTHHPRDCLYYMRDMEVKDLEMLLTRHDIEWRKDYPEEMANKEKVCGVWLQKDTDDGGLQDDACGLEAPDQMGGLCQKHYVEYLVVLINNNGIDPMEVMSVGEMNVDLMRHFKVQLEKGNGENDAQYIIRLKDYLLEEVPLPIRAGRRNAPVIGDIGAANIELLDVE